MPWFVYILECSNGSLYVGSTTDAAKRLERHQCGDGAAHTAKCRPERIIFREEHPLLDSALARERQLKGWSRAKKLALAGGRLTDLRTLAKRRGF
jgi:putative endonuclease